MIQATLGFSSPVRPLFVSTFPPEECGLATFTKDSADAFDAAIAYPTAELMVLRRGESMRYDDPRVSHVLDSRQPDAYRHAGEVASRGACDVVNIQHEFGLYRGSWGNAILDFALACRKPIVTTFHTLMDDPESTPRVIIRHLAGLSRAVVVMTHAAARMLTASFDVPHSKIRVIPHGVPAVPSRSDIECKERLGLERALVLCTFGLISRGKGLEHMIQAMPAIVRAFPEAIYRIVGVTHPLVKQAEGEEYRERLASMAASLGVGAHVQFVNRFLELPELLTHLGACDVYVTPYPHRSQIASGTLAYAMSAGRAIVSTPYIYAEEMLGDGRGLLVPFASAAELAAASVRLLSDERLRAEIRRRAYTYSIPMRWPNVGHAYRELFERVASDDELPSGSRRATDRDWRAATLATETPWT